MTNIFTTFAVCPFCATWVTLEGHEHENEIRRIWEIERKLREAKVTAIPPRCDCVLIPVNKARTQGGE